MKQILAAFIFFTRLPLGKIVQVPAEYFRQVVSYWPLTGYLTGGLMALTIVFLPYLFPIPVAVILAMLTRLSALPPTQSAAPHGQTLNGSESAPARLWSSYFALESVA